MRGADTYTESLFTMERLDDFVPGNRRLITETRSANSHGV